MSTSSAVDATPPISPATPIQVSTISRDTSDAHTYSITVVYPITSIDNCSPLRTVSAYGTVNIGMESSGLKKKQIVRWKKDDIGPVTRGQERVSYENMLVRYGGWKNVRTQVVANLFLIIVSFIYFGHRDFMDAFEKLNTISVERHQLCCCDVPNRAKSLKEAHKKFELTSIVALLKMITGIMVSLSCPIWERFIGRRKMQRGALIAGIPFSLLLMLARFSNGILQFAHLLLDICSIITIMISMANLTEILPYSTRYIAVSFYLFAATLNYSIATLHFHSGFNIFWLSISSAIFYALGCCVSFLFVRDSLCHLNIRNEVDRIEKHLQDEELKIHEIDPEGNLVYHKSCAKKIFEDLVYLDQDEVQFSYFFSRLWKNWTMIEIVLTIFQGFSSGLHDYEMHHFWRESFADSYIAAIHRVIGYSLGTILLFVLRRVHRVKALVWVLSTLLIVANLRHTFIVHSESNKCSDVYAMTKNFEGFAFVFNICAMSLSACFNVLLLLHFFETAPSILRLTCFVFVYGANKLAYEIAPMLFDHSSQTEFFRILPIYTYHLIIIIFTILRSGSKLPFSLYLFDLMPQSEGRKGDDHCTTMDQTVDCSKKDKFLEVSANPISEGAKKIEPLASKRKFAPRR
ncbi:hypothetical protein PRIPAC_75751 [Pristionchus pacificus]|uniref:Uncharacterized protein n=1 Tax=Pristionchus pacificus TaxID=54126 RepID=A0A2A6CA26_PRIPA|nr:hypothetical protein PRIPAC_75751 [Pristionchus pacificus]|eukprot:PDM74928.1 hypothetical protein PRIPAC_40309 [Pristionchus pacificus]